jgi:hypothetical protein
MAHYALVKNGIVERVHVLDNTFMLDKDGVEQEHIGQEFLAKLHGYNPLDLVQCSYNRNFRVWYPGPGFTYNEELDAFLPPKYFESWILDENLFYWVAPVPYPQDGNKYDWDETSVNWVLVE